MSPGAANRSDSVPDRTDAGLVAAIRDGRTEAWGEVYDRYLDRVYAVCFAVLHNRADAEDAAQSAFLKAVERIGQLREGDALAPWLCGIARRCALDRIRAGRETPVDEWPAAGPVHEPDPSTGLRRSEAVSLVTEALDGLDARDRLALVMADAQECDGDTLAGALGVRRDHAYVLVRRARDRFGKSVTALVVGRTGRRECAELARLVGPEGVGIDPRQRKRVARHIEQCERCRRTRDAEVSPAALLSMLPPVVAPVALRERLLAATSSPGPAASATSSTRPVRAAGRSRLLVGATTGAAVAVVAAVAVTVWPSRGEESSTGRPTDTTPVTGAPTTAPTTGAPVVDEPQPDYCAIAGEWLSTLTPGPSSPDPASVEQWFTTSLGYVERLAAAAPEDVAASWSGYASAYGDLVETLRLSGWNLAAAGGGPPDPALTALRDELEADVSSRCGLG